MLLFKRSIIPFAVAQTLSLAKTEAQMLYAQLLPTLGYDFLTQFDELELLSFFLQARDCNIDLSLELLLTNASLYSLGTLVSLPFFLKSEKRVLFLDKI